MRINPWLWLIVLLAFVGLGEGLGALIAAQGTVAGGGVVAWIGRIAATAWIGYGLFRWKEVIWVRRIGLLVIGTVVAALLALFGRGMELTAFTRIVIGIYLMAVSFYIGLTLIRFLLSLGHPVFGVARTLLDEAIRMRVPLVFIVILIVLVPVLPFVMDPQDMLRYRIATFLQWSITAVTVLLSLMTVFLAVGTITSEIQNRQIFLSMSKPVSRWQYLLGKWLGIGALNLLLVGLCGGAIYLLTMTLADQPARNLEDAIAVNQRVLVARIAENPKPIEPGAMQQRYEERLEQLRIEDPERYGNVGDTINDINPTLRADLQQSVMAQWFSIGPRQTQTYRFTGLSRAKTQGQTVQFRIKPKLGSSSPDNMVYLNARVNDRPFTIPPLVDDTYHVVDIPVSFVDDDGNMTIALTNAVIAGREQPSITFNLNDGIELFYRVGSFQGNLVRSLIIVWLQLAFLAMLGIAAGTFLGFPVACLVCLLIYLVAAASGYVNQSLADYSAFPNTDLPLWERITAVLSLIGTKFSEGDPWAGIRIIIRLVGMGFMMLVPSFGTYSPGPLLNDGRLISGRMLRDAALNIGLIWTGIVAIIGYLIFRARELARVTV